MGEQEWVQWCTGQKKNIWVRKIKLQNRTVIDTFCWLQKMYNTVFFNKSLKYLIYLFHNGDLLPYFETLAPLIVKQPKKILMIQKEKYLFLNNR